MKTIKSIIPIVAIMVAVAGVFAFSPSPEKAGKESKFTTYFELVSGGNKLDREDWVISSNDPSCSTVHSSMPCRIEAEADGDNPSLESFGDVRVATNDFTQAASGVTYKP